jgi:hypothetical protein
LSSDVCSSDLEPMQLATDFCTDKVKGASQFVFL